METNTTFTLSGILKQYGTSTPTLTFRQSSYADPVITFIGAETAEGAGDFAGDIVFEETALPDGKYGTAHVRAVGFEPFGPDGTLHVKSQGQSHNALARRARLTLANAVVSKAVEYGDYYMMGIYAEDGTTNAMNGAFTPFRDHASSGTFPPDFHVGSNAVLRLAGEMDFGTRPGSNNSIVSVGSTAENGKTNGLPRTVHDAVMRCSSAFPAQKRGMMFSSAVNDSAEGFSGKKPYSSRCSTSSACSFGNTGGIFRSCSNSVSIALPPVCEMGKWSCFGRTALFLFYLPAKKSSVTKAVSAAWVSITMWPAPFTT